MENESKKELKNNRISAIDWVIIIAIGVFCGNTLSFSLYEFYKKNIYEETLEKTEIASKNQQAIIAAEDNALRQNIEKQKSSNEYLYKMCNYWRGQVKKDDTKENRKHRNTACAKLQ